MPACRQPALNKDAVKGQMAPLPIPHPISGRLSHVDAYTSSLLPDPPLGSAPAPQPRHPAVLSRTWKAMSTSTLSPELTLLSQQHLPSQPPHAHLPPLTAWFLPEVVLSCICTRTSPDLWSPSKQLNVGACFLLFLSGQQYTWCCCRTNGTGSRGPHLRPGLIPAACEHWLSVTC